MGSKTRGSATNDTSLFKPESSENEREGDGFISLREQQMNRMKYEISMKEKNIRLSLNKDHLVLV